MKFAVIVVREICHEVELEIEAATPAEARKIAERKAVDMVFTKKHVTEYRAIASRPVE